MNKTNYEGSLCVTLCSSLLHYVPNVQALPQKFVLTQCTKHRLINQIVLVKQRNHRFVCLV